MLYYLSQVKHINYTLYLLSTLYSTAHKISTGYEPKQCKYNIHNRTVIVAWLPVILPSLHLYSLTSPPSPYLASRTHSISPLLNLIP